MLSVGLSLELGWAEIAERGVHSGTVVPEQPFKRGVLCLPVGVEVHPMQSLDLQRSEQGLRAGVVPAVSLAAHRSPYPVVLKPGCEGGAGALAAAVAVEISPVSLPGDRPCQAMSSASAGSLALISALIDQPTMRRLNRSSTVAKYNQPCRVGM